jgi:hypothetical protein
MMLIRVQIQGQLVWRMTRDPRSDRFVAVCDPLAITAEAETWSKLTEIIDEEVNALFRDLFEEGELQDFFRERGWRPLADTPLPTSMPKEGMRFDVPMDIQSVPFELLAQKDSRHAQA